MDRRGLAKILDGPPFWLIPLLFALSLLYGAVSAFNRMIFRRRLRRIRRLPRPVVSVGNIAVGGGGKTPLVIWLASRLRKRGIRVAVLTRGYGSFKEGKKGAISELHDSTGPGALRAGDEPTLMSQKLEDVPIYVCADRYRAGLYAIGRREIDLFLLDDGFQHFALHRDLDVVVIDDHRRLGNGTLIPSGILREPATRLRDADFIVVTKAGAIDEKFTGSLKEMTDAPISWANYVPVGLIHPGEDRVLNVRDLESTHFLAFSGIANPRSFELSLRELPLIVVDHVRFRDHHRYSSHEVNFLSERAEKMGARALLTTEKDLVRWPSRRPTIPCYALAMDAVFLSGEDILIDRVISLVGERAGGAGDG